MFVKLKDGEQSKLLKLAISLSGSQRKLSKIVDIPHQSLARYVDGKLMPRNRFNEIADFVNIKNKEEIIEKILRDDWGQVNGGKRSVISKKEKGTFLRDMKVLQNIQSKRLKEWHKNMKKDDPEKYHLIQYARFKKIGLYKHNTLKGEKVRNQLEKDVADILAKHKIDYAYEPIVRAGNKFFFPDFLINKNIILECTMWRGSDKAVKLKEKINKLGKNYRVFVIIPKNLYHYYKDLDSHLIQGLDEFSLLAKSFKRKISENRLTKSF